MDVFNAISIGCSCLAIGMSIGTIRYEKDRMPDAHCGLEKLSHTLEESVYVREVNRSEVANDFPEFRQKEREKRWENDSKPVERLVAFFAGVLCGGVLERFLTYLISLFD